ncbi:hypothetical protein RO3G_12041 [Rhizopus delemar RA 99-880]|uniref:Uncharacterized protein n=1 Tax=Rhizopus delemar (strain RA 99-880 / ATCC MYA-4621 / FGSC 9543 / NRRL 43880) TaxID=246409 RepID=I1CFV0_RHIO9|nr:hypothetical protein RO3G_12041 [Rhizopus delemar RA 99-880]|eukprot:EIE87330.1 hypothetical protein RO3G_12041 [Rhizopus delemar RA 99-880]
MAFYHAHPAILSFLNLDHRTSCNTPYVCGTPRFTSLDLGSEHPMLSFDSFAKEDLS